MATSSQVGVGIAGGLLAGIAGYALYDRYKANVKAAGDAQEQLGRQIRDAAVADYNSKQALAAGDQATADAHAAKAQELLGKQIQTQAQIDYYTGQKAQNEAQIAQLAAQKGISITPSQIQQQALADNRFSSYLKIGLGLAFVGAVGFVVMQRGRK